MGGSSAGAKAINMRIEGNVFFLDNYDPTYLQNFFKDNNIKDFTIYVISKSGSTFETLAMCNLIFQHLLKNIYDRRNYKTCNYYNGRI